MLLCLSCIYDGVNLSFSYSRKRNANKTWNKRTKPRTTVNASSPLAKLSPKLRCRCYGCLTVAEKGRECLLWSNVWSIPKNCGGCAKNYQDNTIEKQRKKRTKDVERKQTSKNYPLPLSLLSILRTSWHALKKMYFSSDFVIIRQPKKGIWLVDHWLSFSSTESLLESSNATALTFL